MFKIYPSITSTAGNWKELIQETKDLNLKEVCFFPTVLNEEERKEAYQLLEKTQVERIPLVHLKSDMDNDEIYYLLERFKTSFFNVHSQINSQYIHKNDLSKFKNICLENTFCSLDPEVENYAGICLDTSHLENERLKNGKLYQDWINSLKKYPVGVVHLNAITKTLHKIKGLKELGYDTHHFENLSEFDYVKRYQKYLPETIALELENPIQEQLKAKDYLEKLLGEI